MLAAAKLIRLAFLRSVLDKRDYIGKKQKGGGKIHLV